MAADSVVPCLADLRLVPMFERFPTARVKAGIDLNPDLIPGRHPASGLGLFLSERKQ